MQTLKIYDKKNKPAATSAKEIFKIMKDIKDTEKELSIVFYLDCKLKIIAREIVLIGILDACLVHPREIFRGAILRNAKCIILSHNHPSGDPSPSTEDIEVYNKLKECGQILDIKLLDNIIVSDSGYYSFNENKRD